MSAPDMSVIDVLMQQAECEIRYGNRLEVVVLNEAEGRVVVPYHFDDGGTRNVELHWDDDGWRINRDGQLCPEVLITGEPDDFRAIQAVCYKFEVAQDG